MPSWILPAIAAFLLIGSIALPITVLICLDGDEPQPDDSEPDYGMTGRVSPADFERTER